ncbi:MAG: tRNA (N6-threonylcarbamoyladenosine(37)-N6)-methyltransferase TrmO [Deltaproteobacteria bacterium]|nr:tRNA (N6-threonylcarbamoyladenosine(37)-N6)-methyltransferase TrmO [Deltaproteobacteria bacterium]MBW1817290.1 tRNA (N6-threonylcarbamoyladenosine(37)-N6)-methyltransferase TrmO [Deltaproteobacteria bacterium]
METEFIFRPIGVLNTPYRTKSGVPIQGAFDPQSEGTAEIFKPFEEGLRDLEGFSHLILLYVFDRSEGYDLVCRPYMEDRRHGVFAMRAPRRPNPIGFSVVRLKRREGRMLHLAELDMLDGTPLLDIKPFVPKFDHRADTRVGWMENTFRNKNHRKVSDERF